MPSMKVEQAQGLVTNYYDCQIAKSFGSNQELENSFENDPNIDLAIWQS